MSKKFQTFVLGGILVIAALLRFFNLSHQGIMVFDDGTYLIAAQKVAEESSRLAEAYGVSPGEIMIAQSYHRPGFLVLVMLGAHLVGWSPLAGAAVSAILGSLTIVFVYGMTRELFERRAALLATALFATSTWHIFQSRVGLSNATATFFFTAGLCCWLRFRVARPHSLLLPFTAGLLFGYAFTCHYGILLYLSVLGILEMWQVFQLRASQGTLALLVGCFLPYAGFYAVGGYNPWGEILRLGQVQQSHPEFFYYFRILWRYETLPFLLFALLGMIRAGQVVKSRPLSHEGVLYLLGGASLLFLSLQAASGNARPRLMAPLLPLLGILAAGGTTLMLGWVPFRRRPTVLWSVALFAILLAGVYANRGFFWWHSGYQEAVAYLHAHYPTSRSVCHGAASVCEFYRLGPQVVNVKELQTLSPPADVLFAHGLDPTWERGVFGQVPARLVVQFENLVERDLLIGEETGGAASPDFAHQLGVIRLYDLETREHLEKKEGVPALLVEAMQGNAAAVIALLNKGAEVDARNGLGQTPLMLAAANGHIATVTTLLEGGADVHAKSRDGADALMFATARGQTATAALLLARGASINARDDGGRTALIFAVANGHAATVAFLLEKGADVHAKDRRGHTAFMRAVATRHAEILQLLRNAGAKE